MISDTFRHDNEEGAALAEYALLVVFIAVVCFAVVSLLGGNINTGLFQLAAGL